MESLEVKSFGRPLLKLRVSLLDACNFGCVYCMPETAAFCNKEDYLSPDEIVGIVGNLVEYGIEEVRLTGGEPTLRHDLACVAEKLGKLPLKKISITTNASRLLQFLPALADGPCRSLNISLDSLEPSNFEKITNHDGLGRVLDAIERARALGFKIKINMVVMKGLNHHEINHFVRFAEREQIEVRFLEVMNIGVVRSHFKQWYYSGRDILRQIESEFTLSSVKVAADSTAQVFSTAKGGRIGLIASESMPFCDSCSRLRLSSKGILRACLMKEDGKNLRGVPSHEYPALLQEIAAMKPLTRIKEIHEPMYQIGG
ncbi:MAG: GTP 3',8-cyclase MoaA [Bdellovibrio sp.]|nr:GTP 3',8-cyclase MoaA [Bdellovibrio sp.]